tara:strand:+ start:794 stop:967 length:174 start_codon:yes stop_codon:yes gene_type:complete
MKKYLIIFIWLIGCSNNQNLSKTNYTNFNFSKDLTLKEFKLKLESYAINSPYPNIDN